jgi:predicted DNA-binding transcriptional regulator YafY
MRRSHQVIRLLGLLKALQDGERLHVAQLAARFHVRRETVYRDLHALEELGVPIVGDLHGVKSRPRLASRSSPKSFSIPFTLSELLALAFAASAFRGFTKAHNRITINNRGIYIIMGYKYFLTYLLDYVIYIISVFRGRAAWIKPL